MRSSELRLSRAQIAAVVAHLDTDRSGKLEIDEIERALRDARKRQRDIPPCDALTRARTEARRSSLSAAESCLASRDRAPARLHSSA